MAVLHAQSVTAQIIGISDAKVLDESTPYAQAQRAFEQKDYELALRKCRQALQDEWPERFENRILATAARCCLMIHQHEGAIHYVERIHHNNPSSPYISLLPLVWDHRLPESERHAPGPGDLTSSSPVRQFAAASAFLLDEEYGNDSHRILSEFRASGLLPLTTIAETQLWRLRTNEIDSLPLGTVHNWSERLSRLPEATRGGPQFVVGRALHQHHRVDEAALHFLWLPMMEHDDSYLAASSLFEAIQCLEETGRRNEARLLRRELLDRFSDSSAARRLRRPGD